MEWKTEESVHTECLPDRKREGRGNRDVKRHKEWTRKAQSTSPRSLSGIMANWGRIFKEEITGNFP